MNRKRLFISKVLVSYLLVMVTFVTSGGYQVLENLLPLFTPRKVEAATQTLTKRVDWEAGVYSGTESDTNQGSVRIEADGSWLNKEGRTPPWPINAGGTYLADGEFIYAFAGNTYSKFLRYQPSTDSWKEMADTPVSVYGYSDMVKIGDYIYAEFGYYQEYFYRYHIPTNAWEELARLPELANYASALVTDGSSIYFIRGTAREVYVYSLAENTWTLHGLLATTFNYSKAIYDNGFIYYHNNSNPGWWYKYELATKTNTRLTNTPGYRYYDSDFEIHDGYIYLLRGANTTEFWRYKIADNTWEVLTATPGTTYQGGGVVYHTATSTMYVFRGNGTYDFWKYDIAGNDFVGIADAPIAIGNGGDLVRYQDKFYVPRGSGTTTFYEYDITSDVWTTKAALPAVISYRTLGVAAGSYVYFYQGNNTTNFYRYNPAADSWTTMAVTPSTVSYGGVLGYPGSGDYIYGARGNNTNGYWRYSISGDSWDDVGAADLPTGTGVYQGAAMTTDGTDLYMMQGFGVSKFFKYVVATDTWVEQGNLPFAPYDGADIAYNSGKIYATEGNWDKDFWEYNIGSSSWRKLPDFEGIYVYDRGVGTGAFIEFDGSGNLYMLRGSGVWFNKYTPSSYAYKASGTWVSEVQDLSYVSGWNSLNVSSTTAGDSSVGVETRTSTDLSTWSDFEALSGSSIVSPTGRYIQVKLTLNASTDRAQTPIVTEVSIDYDGDTIVPSSPDTVYASSQSVSGTVLTSGQSYSYPHPYFSWSGESDGQTGVAGYYVYFGVNAAADPQTDGSWQEVSNYIVTEPLEQNSYYLRVKTKDEEGNVSSIWDAFTYVYSGIPSEYEISVSSSDEFTAGDLSSIQPWDDELKLASDSGGLWLEERISLAPTYMSYGSKSMGYVASSNKFYMFRGHNSLEFYEYNLASDVWTRLTDAPSAVYVGGGVVEGPEGYLYGMPGNNSNTFWMYSITEDTWYDAEAADMPQAVYYGASLVYDGSRYIYALRGNSDDAFWKYDTLSNVWSTLAAVDFGYPDTAINNLVYTGGNLAYDGGDTLYAIQGSTRGEFSAYSITTNTWTPLTDLPTFASLGATITYDTSNNKLYYAPGNSFVNMYTYDATEQTWTRIDDAPMTIYYGATIRYIDGYIYLKIGGHSQYFYKYKVATNRWTIPTRGLFGTNYAGTSYDTFSYGDGIVKGEGSNYYMIRGSVSNDFIRYNSTSGEVTWLADLPTGAYYSSGFAYDGVNGKVYYMGYQMQKLFVYDIASDSWSEDDAPPVLANTYGSNFVYDGSRYLYWTRGQTTSFYRFDTQGSPGSKWTQMTNIPYMDYGGGMVYRDGYIYATRGGYTYSFYRYDVVANTWSDPAVADVPTGYRVAYGGAMADGGDGYIYVMRGENTSHFMRYGIAGNSWEIVENIPANATWGGALAGDGASRIFAMTGAGGNNTISDGLYSYVQQTDTSGFVTSGTYLSQVFDLTKVYRFSNIRLTYTLPSGTGIVISTRTSADGVSFSSWDQASQVKEIGSTYEYQINSAANQYIQVKIVMTSDYGISSPSVSDYTINYVQDLTAPQNPVDAGFDAYNTSTMSAELVSGAWDNESGPYFVWPEAEATNGATDGSTGSGVAGYYVYFGTTADADPVVSGSFQAGHTYTASSLVSGNTYYLRIKAYDNAGNEAALTWEPFIYKYDSVVPTAPDDLAADPSGYSAVNNFDFSWSVATDSASGIAGYCYKTATSSGQLASDQCTTELAIPDLTAYKTGTNTFYVRTKDNAGNYSAYTTTGFYYNADAPSPPTNLTVTPSSNDTNSFAFSWGAPEAYYGAVGNIRYYYTVNAIPTANNVTETPLPYLNAGAYATLPGDNYFYVVAKDEAGNIDYGVYAQVVFTANTTAPGLPINMDIADVSVKATKSWKLAISWEEPEDAGSGVASYQVYRSTDGSSYSRVATTGGISYVDTGLTQTTYYYKIKGCDSANNCGAFGSEVHYLPDGKWLVAATLTAEPEVSGVTTKKATITWSTNRTSDSRIAYGTASGDYIDEEVANSTQVTYHVLSITNLAPGTTYYYVVRWVDEDGNLGTSDEMSFVTEPAPSAKEVSVVNIGLDSAILQFTSTGASEAKIAYGKGTDFGGLTELAVSPLESTYSVQLTGLLDGTKYYYRIDLLDSEGAEYPGDTYSFETLPRPKISGVKLQQVKGTASGTILVTWNTNTPISSIATYYPSANPSAAQDNIDVKLVTAHRALISSLLPNTSYSLIVKGRDKVGNEAIGELQLFTTSSDTRPPSILNLKVDPVIQGVGQDSTAQLVVSWDTDELGSSQVAYGEGSGGSLSSKTQLDTSRTYNHLVVIPNLQPSKVYHLRALSMDEANNESQSIDRVVITPKATESALNLVVSNLSTAFGFLGGISGNPQ